MCSKKPQVEDEQPRHALHSEDVDVFDDLELKPIHKSNITPRPMNIVDDEILHHKYFEHYKCSPIKWFIPTITLLQIIFFMLS